MHVGCAHYKKGMLQYKGGNGEMKEKKFSHVYFYPGCGRLGCEEDMCMIYCKNHARDIKWNMNILKKTVQTVPTPPSSPQRDPEARSEEDDDDDEASLQSESEAEAPKNSDTPGEQPLEVEAKGDKTPPEPQDPSGSARSEEDDDDDDDDEASLQSESEAEAPKNSDTPGEVPLEVEAKGVKAAPSILNENGNVEALDAKSDSKEVASSQVPVLKKRAAKGTSRAQDSSAKVVNTSGRKRKLTETEIEHAQSDEKGRTTRSEGGGECISSEN